MNHRVYVCFTCLCVLTTQALLLSYLMRCKVQSAPVGRCLWSQPLLWNSGLVWPCCLCVCVVSLCVCLSAQDLLLSCLMRSRVCLVALVINSHCCEIVMWCGPAVCVSVSVSLCVCLCAQDLLLSYLMRSKVKRLLGGTRDQQPLLKFIDDAMVVADRKHVLEVALTCVPCDAGEEG